MAEITNLTLSLDATDATADSLAATVAFGVVFSDEEVSSSARFRLSIHLVPAQGVGDPPEPFFFNGPLYVFRFGPLFFRSDSVIVTAQKTPRSFNETRTIDADLLNEDPGIDTVFVSNPRTGEEVEVDIPRIDEVAASVLLDRLDDQATSPPVEVPNRDRKEAGRIRMLIEAASRARS